MYRAFESLRLLIGDNYDALPACRAPSTPDKPGFAPDASDEDRIFLKAMAGVRPLPQQRCIEPLTRKRKPSPAAGSVPSPEVTALQSLVDRGEGFVVALTPEYMEGTGPGVPTTVLQKLHRGDFSIQDHIDLHGLTLCQARPALEKFLSSAVETGKRAVLIIHGRGLSSPKDPVLKTHVKDWLSRSAWRRWVLAFSSARLCDGGAGATCVLLRSRAMKRRRS